MIRVLLFLILAVLTVSAQATDASKVERIPGETLTLNFPELGNMAKGLSAECQIRFPENYNEVDRFPLFVWFGGGGGSSSVGGAQGIVDFDKFIVVALPYPDGRLPRLGVRDGGIEDFEAFHSTMLKRIRATVPNISETARIAGGSSSGGHLLGSALDLDWPEFTGYFTAFVLHEGGYAPYMTYRGIREGSDVLVTYGENSKSRTWQEGFIKKFRIAYPPTTFVEIPEAGHGLNADGKQAIHQWIEDTFL